MMKNNPAKIKRYRNKKNKSEINLPEQYESIHYSVYSKLF